MLYSLTDVEKDEDNKRAKRDVFSSLGTFFGSESEDIKSIMSTQVRHIQISHLYCLLKDD